jgi:hypothetical protein
VSAALVDFLPLQLNASSSSIFPEGRTIGKVTEAHIAYDYSVTPDYFRTMQTHVLKGREFDSRDSKEATRVAVVNRAFAHQVMRDDDPLGKRFRIKPDGKPIEIVGLAENGKYFSLTEVQKPAMWMPLEIFYSPNVSLIARTQGSAADVLGELRQAVRGLDPAVALYGCGDARAATRLGPLSRAAGGRSAGRVRPTGGHSCGHRNLRDHGLRRIAANPRDRNSHGDWCGSG